MPLSKKRNRDRMKELRLHNKEVQPKQAKISELRDMMDNIHSDPLDIDNRREDWPEIDADGHPIPDF